MSYIVYAVFIVHEGTSMDIQSNHNYLKHTDTTGLIVLLDVGLCGCVLFS